MIRSVAPGFNDLEVEYQYWMNKLGGKDTDESAVQGLLFPSRAHALGYHISPPGSGAPAGGGIG